MGFNFGVNNDSTVIAFVPVGGAPSSQTGKNNIVPFYRSPTTGFPARPYTPPTLVNPGRVPLSPPPTGGLLPGVSPATLPQDSTSPFWPRTAVRLEDGRTLILVQTPKGVSAFAIDADISRGIDNGYTGIPPGDMVPASSFEDPDRVGNHGWTHYAHRVPGSYSQPIGTVNLNLWQWASPWELIEAVGDSGVRSALIAELQELVNQHGGNFDKGLQAFARHFNHGCEELILANEGFFRQLINSSSQQAQKPPKITSSNVPRLLTRGELVEGQEPGAKMLRSVLESLNNSPAVLQKLSAQLKKEGDSTSMQIGSQNVLITRGSATKNGFALKITVPNGQGGQVSYAPEYNANSKKLDLPTQWSTAPSSPPPSDSFSSEPLSPVSQQPLSPATMSRLTTTGQTLLSQYSALQEQLKALEKPEAMPSLKDIRTEGEQWKSFSGQVAALRTGFDRLQEQISQAFADGKINFDQYQQLTQNLFENKLNLTQFEDRFIQAKANQYTRAIQNTEAAIKAGEPLPYGNDAKKDGSTYQKLANHAQWYTEKASKFNFSPESRQGFEKRVQEALESGNKPKPVPPVPTIQTPVTEPKVNNQDPAVREQRQLEAWRQAREEADRIIREAQNRTKLRPPTANEMQELVNSPDPLVRSMVEAFFKKGSFPGGGISFDMAWRQYEQAVREGVAWLIEKGVDPTDPAVTSQQIAEKLLAEQVPPPKAPGVYSNVWTALDATGRAQQVRSALSKATSSEPLLSISDSSTLDNYLQILQDAVYQNRDFVERNGSQIVSQLAELINSGRWGGLSPKQMIRTFDLIARKAPGLINELLQSPGVKDVLVPWLRADQTTAVQAQQLFDQILNASSFATNIDVISSVFGHNISPMLNQLKRDIIDAGQNFAQYRSTTNQEKESMYDHLYNEFPDIFGQNDKLRVLNNIDELAKTLNIDTMQLVQYLTQQVKVTREILNQNYGEKPLGVVNDETHGRAVDYLSALYGELYPQQVDLTHPDGIGHYVHLVEGNMSLVPDGRYTRVEILTDLDGVYFESYGQQGVDFLYRDEFGEEQLLHVDIPVSTGTLQAIDDLVLETPEGGNAHLSIRIKKDNGQQETLNYELDSQGTELLRSAQPGSIKFEMVKELSARKAGSIAMDFFNRMDERAKRGEGNLNGLGFIRFGGNTFGTIGRERVREGHQPAALRASFERSASQLPTQAPIYSGGTTKTSGGETSYIPGFPKPAQDLLQAVSQAIPEMIQELGDQNGMPQTLIDSWKRSVFDNPDIPSIFITPDVIDFYRDGFGTGANAELDKLQQSIEAKMQSVYQNHPGAVYFDLHHTKPMPKTAEDIAPFTGAVEEGRGITVEWQLAVKGRKIMPTFYFYTDHFLESTGIDLWKELVPVVEPILRQRHPNLTAVTVDQVQEYMWSLDMDGVADVLKKLKSRVEENHPEVRWPKLIISADTLGPGMTGSDIGMVQLGNLIGWENLVVVHTNTANPIQVDLTTRGKPFEVDPNGNVTKKSVPGIVHMYIYAGPGEWAKICLEALNRQQKLDSGDISDIRNRPR